jgi:ribonuclease HI
MSRSTPSLFGDAPTSPSVPQVSWVTAHCDGGARGNPGPAGFGAVLTDASGHVLAELSEFLGHRTNNFAEYAGLLACLQWALDHGQRQLRVVSDSLLMVSQIQGKYKVKAPDLLPLWQEARHRIAQLERFEISHALRHKNKDADRLANQAMDRGMGRGGAQTPAFGVPTPAAEAPAERNATAPRSSAGPAPTKPAPAKPAPAKPAPTSPAPAAAAMLRGFTRDGAIHLLGGARLPDGIFVKIIPE